MREILSIHIGQCGTQLGASIWSEFCQEHGVNLDGTIPCASPENPCDGFSTIFSESMDSKCHPNALFIDLEPSVIDNIRKGPMKHFFSKDQLISSNEDAASMYPRGYYVGEKILNPVINEIRAMLETFDSIQGIMMFRAAGGGTGSGFTSLLLDGILYEMIKQPIIEVALYPSKVSGVLEPYNSTLSTCRMFQQINCSFMVDNEAMYRISSNELEHNNINFINTNQMVARAVSTLTASIRFKGPLNVDLTEFETNLVPYQSIHFPFISFSPLVFDKSSTMSIQRMTKSCFEHSNRFLSVEAECGEYVSCCLVYRGNVVTNDINSAITYVKAQKLAKFVEWSPTGFKIGINSNSSSLYDKAGRVDLNPEVSVVVIANSTSIQESWEATNKRFESMYRKKAFIHWFLGEGLTLDDFEEAHEAILNLEMEYLQLKKS